MARKTYTPLWTKYRPAILQLMIASDQGPQEYKLYEHEFQSINSKIKSGLSFTLEAYRGKPMNNIKKWDIARDLLDVLGESKKASELMDESTYEFAMDKKFVLHIKRTSAAANESV
jgi:hypothetical protein